MTDYQSYCSQVNGFVYNSSCYKYIATVSNSWADAYTLCQNEGNAENLRGRLAWLPDAATWLAVSGYLLSVSANLDVWIGSMTTGQGADPCCFYWMNTTTDFSQKISPPYLNSIPNQITTKGNLCLRIHSITTWWDANCTVATYSRLCEYIGNVTL